MLALNEEFFLRTSDFTISSGATYRIPQRAIGSKLRDLKMVDASGNYTKISRLFEEDRSSGKSGYYVTRNSIELTSGFTSNTLRMTYFCRPSELVATTDCGQITSIDTALNQVVVSSAPSTFALAVSTDFVQDNNPYDLLAMDSAITGISGTTITYASLPDGLAVGDWVCIAGESPVPMVPDEMHPVLVQSALCKTLSSKKDKAFKEEVETLEKVKQAAKEMLNPRVENDSQKMRSGTLLNYFSSRGW